jgi:hypothetical protein
MECVVSFIPRKLYLQGTVTPVPTEQEADWATGTVWTLWTLVPYRKWNFSSFDGELTEHLFDGIMSTFHLQKFLPRPKSTIWLVLYKRAREHCRRTVWNVTMEMSIGLGLLPFQNREICTVPQWPRLQGLLWIINWKADRWHETTLRDLHFHCVILCYCTAWSSVAFNICLPTSNSFLTACVLLQLVCLFTYIPPYFRAANFMF